MQHAVIAIEDKRFYTNPASTSAASRARSSRTSSSKRAAQGASTIAQQFVKNALAGPGQPHRLREAARGGARLPPDAQVVQGEDPHRVPELDLLRQRRLRDRVGGADVLRQGPEPPRLRRQRRPARAPRSCSRGRPRCSPAWSPRRARYDPVAAPGRRQAPARPRAARTCSQQGHLTRAQYDDALQQPLPVGRRSTRRACDTRRARTSRPGCASSWSTASAPEQAFEGGLKIKTTLDLDLQKAAEAAISTATSATRRPDAPRWWRSTTRPARSARWSAARDYATAAVQPRHPGPAPAGLVVQAVHARRGAQAGISANDSSGPRASATSSSRARRARSTSSSTTTTAPTPGTRSLGQATTYSDNSVYAAVGIKVGTKKIARLARRMGIRTPVSHNLAMTLGGLNRASRPLDMAHAYETFATGGAPHHAARSGANERRARSAIDVGRAHQGRQARSSDEQDRARPRVLSPRLDRPGGRASCRRSSRTAPASARAVRRVRRRQDRHDRELRRRLVRRLHRQDDGRRLGRLPERLKPMETEFRGEPVDGRHLSRRRSGTTSWRRVLTHRRPARGGAHAKDDEQRADDGPAADRPTPPRPRRSHPPRRPPPRPPRHRRSRRRPRPAHRADSRSTDAGADAAAGRSGTTRRRPPPRRHRAGGDRRRRRRRAPRRPRRRAAPRGRPAATAARRSACRRAEAPRQVGAPW